MLTNIQIPTRAHVTPDTDLADLRAIKAAWIQAARDLDYPTLAWNVARNLGKRVFWVGYQGWLFVSGDVTLFGLEDKGPFSLPRNSFVTRRSVSAYVAKGGDHKSYPNPADNRIVNSHQVMYWTWLLYEDDTPEEDADRTNKYLFIPGQWMNAVLRAQADAEAAIKVAAQKKLESDRQNLLAELLLGVDV